MNAPANDVAPRGVAPIPPHHCRDLLDRPAPWHRLPPLDPPAAIQPGDLQALALGVGCALALVAAVAARGVVLPWLGL